METVVQGEVQQQAPPQAQRDAANRDLARRAQEQIPAMPVNFGGLKGTMTVENGQKVITFDEGPFGGPLKLGYNEFSGWITPKGQVPAFSMQINQNVDENGNVNGYKVVSASMMLPSTAGLDAIQLKYENNTWSMQFGSQKVAATYDKETGTFTATMNFAGEEGTMNLSLPRGSASQDEIGKMPFHLTFTLGGGSSLVGTTLHYQPNAAGGGAFVGDVTMSLGEKSTLEIGTVTIEGQEQAYYKLDFYKPNPDYKPENEKDPNENNVPKYILDKDKYVHLVYNEAMGAWEGEARSSINNSTTLTIGAKKLRAEEPTPAKPVPVFNIPGLPVAASEGSTPTTLSDVTYYATFALKNSELKEVRFDYDESLQRWSGSALYKGDNVTLDMCTTVKDGQETQGVTMRFAKNTTLGKAGFDNLSFERGDDGKWFASTSIAGGPKDNAIVTLGVGTTYSLDFRLKDPIKNPGASDLQSFTLTYNEDTDDFGASMTLGGTDGKLTLSYSTMGTYNLDFASNDSKFSGNLTMDENNNLTASATYNKKINDKTTFSASVQYSNPAVLEGAEEGAAQEPGGVTAFIGITIGGETGPSPKKAAEIAARPIEGDTGYSELDRPTVTFVAKAGDVMDGTVSPPMVPTAPPQMVASAEGTAPPEEGTPEVPVVDTVKLAKALLAVKNLKLPPIENTTLVIQGRLPPEVLAKLRDALRQIRADEQST